MEYVALVGEEARYTILAQETEGKYDMKVKVGFCWHSAGFL
jgi:hypothetical protein